VKTEGLTVLFQNASKHLFLGGVSAPHVGFEVAMWSRPYDKGVLFCVVKVGAAGIGLVVRLDFDCDVYTKTSDD
jgi:hypothetical protein